MFTNQYQALTNDQIRSIAPAIFAERPDDRCSARYSFIPTITVLDALRDQGFAPTYVMSAKAKDASHQVSAKHLMRLRRVEDLGVTKPDVREVVIVNSHFGSAYNLYVGIFRIACTNGLITGDIDTRLSVWHTPGKEIENVIEGSFRIIEEGERVMGEIEEMKRITLSQPEQLLLAESALSLRFPDETDEDGNVTKKTIFEPADLLRAHRNADMASDLYTVSNRIQENVIKGGLRKYDYAAQKRTSTRAINGIDQNVKLNQELWALTRKMAELKQADAVLV